MTGYSPSESTIIRAELREHSTALANAEQALRNAQKRLTKARAKEQILRAAYAAALETEQAGKDSTNA